jgi:drug/metabolite transporter (DMT)-like permease
MSENSKGTLLMVAAVLVLSPDALLISLVKSDPWVLVFWRGLLTSCTLTCALLFSQGRRMFGEGMRIGAAGVVVGIFFSLSTVSFVMSIRLTTAANTLVIIAAMPLFAAVFTRIFLSEKVPVRTWAAVVSGFFGIVIIFHGTLTGGSVFGDLLALVTAMLMAANFVIIRSHRLVSMVPAVVLSGLFTTCVTAFIIDPFSATATDILLLTVMGSVVMPIPLALMTVAPKLIPAAEVSLIMLLETFLGPFWVWMALGQRPAAETVLGGGVLVGTLVVHALAGRKATSVGVSA